MFLEISQSSQENTCAMVSFLIKLQPIPVNFVKFTGNDKNVNENVNNKVFQKVR